MGGHLHSGADTATIHVYMEYYAKTGLPLAGGVERD